MISDTPKTGRAGGFRGGHRASAVRQSQTLAMVLRKSHLDPKRKFGSELSMVGVDPLRTLATPIFPPTIHNLAAATFLSAAVIIANRTSSSVLE